MKHETIALGVEWNYDRTNHDEDKSKMVSELP